MQASVSLCLVNPQPCSGHFQLSVPFFNGDSADKVALRMTRISKQLRGNTTLTCRLSLLGLRIHCVNCRDQSAEFSYNIYPLNLNHYFITEIIQFLYYGLFDRTWSLAISIHWRTTLDSLSFSAFVYRCS